MFLKWHVILHRYQWVNSCIFLLHLAFCVIYRVLSHRQSVPAVVPHTPIQPRSLPSTCSDGSALHIVIPNGHNSRTTHYNPPRFSPLLPVRPMLSIITLEGNPLQVILCNPVRCGLQGCCRYGGWLCLRPGECSLPGLRATSASLPSVTTTPTKPSQQPLQTGGAGTRGAMARGQGPVSI